MIEETLIRAVCAAVAAIGFGAVSNPSRRSFAVIALLADDHCGVVFKVNPCDVPIISLHFLVADSIQDYLYMLYKHHPCISFSGNPHTQVRVCQYPPPQEGP